MKVGIIGIGNIGSIIADIFGQKGHDLHLVNRHPDKLKRFEGHAKIFLNTEELPDVDILFLCVKPQDSRELLSRIPVCEKERTVVSTITGLSIEEIGTHLNDACIARIMPNIPISIGKGVVAIAHSAAFTDEKKRAVSELLSPFGRIVEVPEKLFSAVTAISGSGPAFVFVIIEALVDAGMKLGLSYDVSMELILETIKGSAELLEREKKHPGELRHIVTSPAGTTIEGIYSLEQQGLRGILMKTIFDTYKRADELQRG